MGSSESKNQTSSCLCGRSTNVVNPEKRDSDAFPDLKPLTFRTCASIPELGPESIASDRLQYALEYMIAIKNTYENTDEWTPDLDAVLEILRDTRDDVALLECQQDCVEVERMNITRNFLLEVASDDLIRPEERTMARWLTDNFLSSDSSPQYDNHDTEDDKRMRSILMKRHIKNSLSGASSGDSFQDPSGAHQAVQTLMINTELEKCLSSLETWDFDVFAVHNICEHHSLSVLGSIIVNNMSYKRLPIEVSELSEFLLAIANNYHADNFYHNVIHAADVLCTLYYYLQSTRFESLQLIDGFAAIIAAACHDVDHPGGLPSYQLARESELAVLYNDRAVLENHHASLGWRILKKHDFICKFEPQQRRHFRRIFINCIRGTDMNEHINHTTFLTTLPKHLQGDAENAGVQVQAELEPAKLEQLLTLAVHAADISNPTKPIAQYERWTKMVMDEFFAQGDQEKEEGLKVSNLCDRDTVEIPTAQLGFINFVVKPFFTLWRDIFYDIGPEFLDHLDRNKAHWEGKLRELHPTPAVSNSPLKSAEKSFRSETTSATRMTRMKSIILQDAADLDYKSPSQSIKRFGFGSPRSRTQSVVNDTKRSSMLSTRSRASTSPDTRGVFMFDKQGSESVDMFDRYQSREKEKSQRYIGILLDQIEEVDEVEEE